MDFKKFKIWKSLTIGGLVGVVTTIPIIATSCGVMSKKQESFSESNPLKIVDSFKNLINPDNTNSNGDHIVITSKLLDRNLTKLINKNDIRSESYRKKLIPDYEKIQDKINTIVLTSMEHSENLWGNNYNWPQQGSFDTYVYYHSDLETLTISSISDLRNQIENKLNQIMEKSLGYKNPSSKFTLVKNSALLIEKSNDNIYDYFKIHVKDIKTNKNIELRLPISNIIYAPKNVEITIIPKVGIENPIPNPIKQKRFIRFYVGINPSGEISNKGNSKIIFNNNTYSTTITENNIDPIDSNGLNQVSAIGLAKELGWYKESSGKKDISKNNNLLKIGNSNINDHNVATSLNMFNVDFTEISLSLIDGNKGIFSLQVKCKPKEGFYWEDGSNIEKPLNIKNNLKIILADATFDISPIFGNTKIPTFETSLIPFDTLNNNQDELNKWINVINGVNNKEKMNQEVKKKLDDTNKIQRKNISVIYQIHSLSKYNNQISHDLPDPQPGTLQLVCKIIPSPGHIFKNPELQNKKSFQFRFVVKNKQQKQ